MGWEVTCSLCGKTEKHGVGCYCYHKERIVNLARMKDANILDVISIDDQFVSAVLYKLQKLSPQKDDETFCLWMNLAEGDKYHSYRRLYEISEEDFQAMSKQANEQAEKLAEEIKKFEEEGESNQGRPPKIPSVYDGSRHDYMCRARFPDGSHCMCGAPPSAWDSDDEGEMPLEEEVKFVRANIDQGEVFSHCQVVGENDFHFFIIREDVIGSWYDIVMTKINENSHVGKGDIVAVSVTGVDITDDETLGIFVQLVKEETKGLSPVV